MLKRVTYSWVVKLPKRRSTESTHLPAKAIDNCDLYIRIAPTGFKNRFDLSIHKTTSSPIMIDITLDSVMMSEEQSKLSYNWRDSCEFLDILCVPVTSCEFTCDITWKLPEAPVRITDPPRSLLFPTENFLMSSSFSDVTIVIGEEELHAHKLILGGYSSVFCQMLCTPMKEAHTSRITIEDIDLETMKTVLTILYKGKCEALSEVSLACKVLAAAHKYDIRDLQDTCVHYLQQLVTANNVIKILKLANLYEQAKLKEVCWRFVMRNKQEIMSTVQFKYLCMTNGRVMDQFVAEVMKACP